MKNTIAVLILAFFMVSNCATAQHKITAKKDKNGYLVGVASKASFLDKDFKGWFNRRFKEYETDPLAIAKLSLTINDFEIKAFMGTWCGDSKREVPRFYKILEETGYDDKRVEMICVDRTKTTPDNLQKGFNLIRVPTFIFYKKGIEIGRFVEYPRTSMEEDFLKIITGKPYKHSYDKS